MRAALAMGLVAMLLPIQEDRIVPVHEEPRHRVVLESPGTRVLDIQIPPGDTTLFHTHSDPIIYVTMSTSRTRSQNFGGDWSAPGALTDDVSGRAGAPRVSPSSPPGRLMSTTTYAEKPHTHRVNNIGDSLFRLIGITNSSRGDGAADPSAGFDSAPELSNRWFRGYRWPLTAQPSTEHRHANPVVIVLVAGRATLTVEQSAATPLAEPGAFAFLEGNAVHRVQGAAADAQVIEVEIRRPR